MTLTTNKKMEQLLIENAFIGQKEPDKMALFSSILDASVVEIDDCYFLDIFTNSYHSSLKTAMKDNTGIECFINHFHIEDYIKGIIKEKDFLIHGFQMTFVLMEKLAIFRETDYFIIIIAIGENTCTVRFHKSRENEYWASPDLESYKFDAMAVIEI